MPPSKRLMRAAAGPARGTRPGASLSLGLVLLAVCLVSACGRPEEASSPPAGGASRAGGQAGGSTGQSEGSSPLANAGEIFVDRGAELGLDFFHFNGMTGRLYMAEIMGPGGALVDLDNDGDLDAYLVQGQVLEPGRSPAEALSEARHTPAQSDRLYRNELVPGQPDSLRFTDVTAASGLGGEDGAMAGYGMGVAAGDFDGDGLVDLYRTAAGPNQLLRNLGDGRFADVTASSGTGDDRWSVPAVFFDFDLDGHLDLYVGNYVPVDLEQEVPCHDFAGARKYCGPAAYPSEPDRLFRNRGDGTFEDVTERAGLGQARGAALGAVAADFDLDGDLDLYVANDDDPNYLWINQGDGTFRDEATLAGCSVSARGEVEGSMGVDAEDFDGDGDLDLFLTHLTRETNTLYRNDGQGLFQDATVHLALAAPSRVYTSFGTAWLDYDNDGWLDLFVASGAVEKIEALARQGDPFPLHQPNQLFRSRQGKAFEEVTAQAGAAVRLSEVSRGVALGDVDNDGDHDLLVVNNNGPARLLINQVGQDQPWLGLSVLQGEPPRPALGATVHLHRRGAPTMVRRVRRDASYCSANDFRVLFGLGRGEEIESVEVRWPDGGRERWKAPPVGRYTQLRQGEGQKEEGTP